MHACMQGYLWLPMAYRMRNGKHFHNQGMVATVD
jgi:hypothetical protein